MPLMSGGDAVVRSLLGHGVSAIYCLPGVQSDHLFNAMFDVGDALSVVHTRHEQGAAYMALGAVLATGRIAAYSVVPGPGFLNSTAALATAYSTGARLLALIGQIPSRAIGKGHGLLHEIPDQIGILRTLTKWAERVERAQDAPAFVGMAFRELSSGRPRPVGLELPPDVLAAKAEIALTPPLPPLPEPPLDEDAIGKAADLLAKAEHPAIFVGGGANDAATEVRALAERLTAPVVAYRRGKGVLDERHPLSHVLAGGHALWAKADVVLAVGTRLQLPINSWGVDDKLKIVKLRLLTRCAACLKNASRATRPPSSRSPAATCRARGNSSTGPRCAGSSRPLRIRHRRLRRDLIRWQIRQDNRRQPCAAWYKQRSRDRNCRLLVAPRSLRPLPLPRFSRSRRPLSSSEPRAPPNVRR
jgi:acetolactate synthase-1/2/3 large subunit